MSEFISIELCSEKVINVVGALTVQHVLIDHDTILPINKTTFLQINCSKLESKKVLNKPF